MSNSQDFTIGFDSMVTLGDWTYVTKGNEYIRYSDPNALTIDAGYPYTISGHFIGFAKGMEAFESGFDAMVLMPNSYLYIFKGANYVRYKVDYAPNPQVTYFDGPFPITQNMDVPAAFATGIQSAVVLPNGKIYFTNANEYIRFSDDDASEMDSGYPKDLGQTTWGLGDLPTFEQSFDSMVVLPNGKTYVTKGDQYIRYSDQDAFTIDGGYPLALDKNWGALPQ